MSKSYKNMETKDWCGYHINHPIAVIDEFFMWYHLDEVIAITKDLIVYAESKEKYNKQSTYELMNIYHGINSLVLACYNILNDDFILDELSHIEKTLVHQSIKHLALQDIKQAFKEAFFLYNEEKWKFKIRKLIYLALESFNEKFGRKLQVIGNALPNMIVAAEAILQYDALKIKILLDQQTNNNELK